MDADGDTCNDEVVLDDAQKANVLANIEANFAAAESTVVTLSQNPVFVTDNVVRLTVSSSLSSETVAVIVGEIAGVGTHFLNVGVQARRRALSDGVASEWLVSISMDGLLAKLHVDTDEDGINDSVDSCPFDADNDADGDLLCSMGFCFDDLFELDPQCSDYRTDGRLSGLCEAAGVCTECACSCSHECIGGSAVSGDVCPSDANNDPDSDVICSSEDDCPFDAENDEDNDNVCGLSTACVETDMSVSSFGTCSDYAVGSRYYGYCAADGLCATCPCSCAMECGSVIDDCPHDPDNDIDGDGVCGNEDSCPSDSSNDLDGDQLCEMVDSCPADSENDADSDGICYHEDSCPFDTLNDIDGDRICADVDSCAFSSTDDGDGDGLCDNVDSCPLDNLNDVDGDGLCGDDDPCPEDNANACNDTNQVVEDPNDPVALDDEMLIIIIAVVCAVR